MDIRSDIYSLGVLLYELLTGSTPVDRNRFGQVVLDEIRRIIREEDPPRPSIRLTSLGEQLSSVSANRGTEPTRLPGLVRGVLDWIAMKCLEKDRTRRYESASGLARDVQRFLEGDAVEACPPTVGYRLRKFTRRHRLAIAATVFVVVCLIASTIVSLVFLRQATHERDGAVIATNESLRRAALEKIQRVRLSDRFAGWSTICTDLLTEAASRSPQSQDQDLATAVLQATDMQLRKQWTGFDSDSVRFQTDSVGLAAGGISSETSTTPPRFWMDPFTAPSM